jgi:hypothetical protein
MAGEVPDLLAPILRELAEERASAMGRVAERLEAAIAKMNAVLVEISASPGSQVLREQFEALRLEAENERWMLMVQREANGITHHGPLDVHYPIPRLPKKA